MSASVAKPRGASNVGGHLPRAARWFCAAAAGLLATAAAAAAPRGRSTVELLTDLARDHALRRSGKQTPADVMQVRALLETAAAIDPQAPEPVLWLYELATLAEDEPQAAEYLQALVRLEPEHEGIFALWLAAGPHKAQTAERRAAWCRSLLTQARTPAQRALVYAHLARLAYERLDLPAADDALRSALEACPSCPDVAYLALELLPDDASVARRLEAALRALATNPTDDALSWQIAVLLDRAGLPPQAAEFFNHAARARRWRDPAARFSADELIQLSQHALLSGDVQAAFEYARRALSVAGPSLEPLFYVHWLADRHDRGDLAGVVRERIGSVLGRRDAADMPPQTAAQAAWYYAFIGSDIGKALSLARSAYGRLPDDPYARRVLGWVLWQAGQNDQARKLLEPLATRDAYAAYALAKMALDAGDADAARAILQNLRELPPVGPQRDLLDSLGLGGAASRPAEVLRQLVDRFDRRVLKWLDEPASFLRVAVRLDDVAVVPGEPWRATFVVENAGPFAITLGPDAMSNPIFLVAVRTEGDKVRDYQPRMTVSLDARRVLLPGQRVTVRRTLDVGPWRAAVRQTPQQLQRVVLRVIYDPVQRADGRWAAAPSGQVLDPIAFNRLPLDPTPELWHAVFADLRDPDPLRRFAAIELLAEALGEAQRARLGRLAYRTQPVPEKQIRAALLAALRGDDWQMRVATLEALAVCGLDRGVFNAVRACLDHEQPAVRLMALRVLARAGQRMAERFDQISRSDPDEHVRLMARAYLSQWRRGGAGREDQHPSPASAPARP